MLGVAIAEHSGLLSAAMRGMVMGGYSANLLIGTVDPLLSGITETAAQMLDPS